MPGARNFFNPQEQTLLVEAIGKAELHTSGEVRLHLANFCFGNEVKAAQKIFQKLGMHKTAERNGVLIYIATYSRKVAIIGDEGIHQKLGTEYWQKLVEKLIQQFKASTGSATTASSTGSVSTSSASTGSADATGSTGKAEALAACIIDCGEQLGKFFPLKSDDKNELSNNISF